MACAIDEINRMYTRYFRAELCDLFKFLVLLSEVRLGFVVDSFVVIQRIRSWP